MLSPIVAGPDVSVAMMNPADYLDDLGLTEEQLLKVKGRVNHVHQSNLVTVKFGLGRLRDTFLHVYNLSAKLTFATSEHLAVFFKLAGFHDHALRSLVRQKMLTIFKPKVRQAIMKDTSECKVGLFSGDQVVSDKITESRKRDGTIHSTVLMPAASKDGEAGKAGAAKK